MMVDRRNRKEKQKNPKKIALTGTKSGVGVTHTGILLAEFLTERMGAKVAFLEWNHHGDVERLEQAVYGYSRPFFTLRGVDYYKGVPREERILEERAYDYLIMDFGTQKKKDQYEIQQCDKKIIIGTLSLWEWQEYLQAVRHFQNNFADGTEKYAVTFGNKKIVSRMEKTLGRKVCLLGFQPLESSLSTEIKEFFCTLA